MKPLSDDEFTAFIGIDWADTKHDICLHLGAHRFGPTCAHRNLTRRVRSCLWLRGDWLRVNR